MQSLGINYLAVNQKGNKEQIQWKVASRRGVACAGVLKNKLEGSLFEAFDSILPEKTDKTKKQKTRGGSQPSESGINTASDVVEILKSVVPAMAGAMVQTINEANEGIATHVAQQIADAFRKQFVFLRYEQDRLEQYSRRESVRIVGMNEEYGEDLNGKVMDLANSLGLQHCPS